MPKRPSDIALFVEYWEVEPIAGMALEVFDPRDNGLYNCVVTRTDENRRIWIKREDRDAEELAAVSCLQPPSSDEDDEDERI